MKVIFHGHSCTEIIADNKTFLIDPWLSSNPLADITPADIKPDYILLSHGHYDHMGDAVKMSVEYGSTVIAVSELAKYCSSKGAHVKIMNIGGSVKLGNVVVKMVRADHTSSIPEDENNIYAGLAAGFVINFDNKTVYHAGDTALFSDMSFILGASPDLALLPIGDCVTMGIDDAVKAAEITGAKSVIPIHYNSFPSICCNPDVFASTLSEKDPSISCYVLSSGDYIEI